MRDTWQKHTTREWIFVFKISNNKNIKLLEAILAI